MTGSIRPQGKGSWEVRLYLGRGHDGRRRYKSHTVAGTTRDARRLLTGLLHGLDTGTYVEPSRITVTHYLARWLADYARTNVGGRTYQRYEEIVRVHLVPALGHHLLLKLQPL